MRNGEDLPSRQEEMRARWSYKRRDPKTWKLISSDAGDILDINKALSNKSKCRVCRRNVARIDKKTGERMPCESCRKKKYREKLAA